MNDNLIFFDGNVLYITLESKVKNWVKWLLIFVNIAIYSFILYVFTFMPNKAEGSFILPLLIVYGVIYLTLTRMTLWNIYGRECMMISKDNFSYYRDFGLYRTPLVHKELAQGLAVFDQQVIAYEKETHVIISFYECLPNKQFQEIITTSIKTQVQNLHKIHSLLNEMYDRPKSTYEFISLN
jgi:hypothetical protein